MWGGLRAMGSSCCRGFTNVQRGRANVHGVLRASARRAVAGGAARPGGAAGSRSACTRASAVASGCSLDDRHVLGLPALAAPAEGVLDALALDEDAAALHLDARVVDEHVALGAADEAVALLVVEPLDV